MSSQVRPTWESAGISAILRAHQFKNFYRRKDGTAEFVCKSGCRVPETLRALASTMESEHQAAILLAAFSESAQMIEETPGTESGDIGGAK